MYDNVTDNFKMLSYVEYKTAHLKSPNTIAFFGKHSENYVGVKKLNVRDIVVKYNVPSSKILKVYYRLVIRRKHHSDALGKLIL